MGKLENWKSILWIFLALAGFASCAKESEPNLILGQWQVFYVDRGGTILGGKKFKGTQYTFRENGTVLAQAHNGDTLTSRYIQNKDTLKYIGISTLAEETYHLDSLTTNRLVISADIDGIPTLIRMLKLKK